MNILIIKKHIVCEYHLIENVNNEQEALEIIKNEKREPYEIEITEQNNQVERYRL